MKEKESNYAILIGLLLFMVSFVNEKIFMFLRGGVQFAILCEFASNQEYIYRSVWEDYPISECITIPKYFKNCFHLKQRNDSVPKEAVYHIWTQIVIFTFIEAYYLFLFNSIKINLVHVGMGMSVIAFMYYQIRICTKAFLHKYVKCTLKNVKYWFGFVFLEEYARKQGMTVRKGKCKIINQYKEKGHAYVDIKMLDDGKEAYRLSVCRYEVIDFAGVYELCEICGYDCVKKDDDILMRAEILGASDMLLSRKAGIEALKIQKEIIHKFLTEDIQSIAINNMKKYLCPGNIPTEILQIANFKKEYMHSFEWTGYENTINHIVQAGGIQKAFCISNDYKGLLIFEKDWRNLMNGNEWCLIYFGNGVGYMQNVEDGVLCRYMLLHR